jgi:hypothetical protein
MSYFNILMYWTALWCTDLFYTVSVLGQEEGYTLSVLGREEGYTVKYTPPPKGVSEGEARGNS